MNVTACECQDCGNLHIAYNNAPSRHVYKHQASAPFKLYEHQVSFASWNELREYLDAALVHVGVDAEKIVAHIQNGMLRR